MGWSFGGIVTMFAVSRGNVFAVAVNQAGGALTWNGTPDVRTALAAAAQKSATPTLLQVAENDRTTDSITTVGEILKTRGVPHRMVIYPPFAATRQPPSFTTGAPGHTVFSERGVSVWASDVLEFLGRYLARPGAGSSLRDGPSQPLPAGPASLAIPRTSRSGRPCHALNLDDLAVLRGLLRHVADVGEHLGAHVGQDHAPGADPSQARLERRVVEVILDLPLVEQGLGDQQIGAAADRQQTFRPLRVAGVGEHLVVAGEAIGEGRRAAEVLHRVRGDGHPVDRHGLVRRNLADLGDELSLDLRRAREEHLHGLGEALAEPGRADQRQRRRPPAVELPVQDHERKAAEMIAVQMRDEDGADAIGIDVEPSHRDHARGAALDEERARGRLHEEAGVESSAAPEGVAASEKPEPHGGIHRTRRRSTMLRLGVALVGALVLTSSAMTTGITPAIRSELAPSGKLRVGLNHGNFLLVPPR